MITENLYMNSHNSWDYRGAWQAGIEFKRQDRENTRQVFEQLGIIQRVKS